MVVSRLWRKRLRSVVPFVLWLAIGRLLVRERRYDAAASWFTVAEARGLLSADMVLWNLEALFKLGRYDKVRETFAQHGDLFRAGGKLIWRCLDTTDMNEAKIKLPEVMMVYRKAAFANPVVAKMNTVGDAIAALRSHCSSTRRIQA